MANWKTNIPIGDLHEEFENGLKTVQEVGKELAARLRKSPHAQDDRIIDLVDQLEALDDVEDYDYLLQELYDFGDQDHRIFFDPIPA